MFTWTGYYLSKPVIILRMVGNPRLEHAAATVLGIKTTKKKKIVVGLKSHHCSREILLRLLTLLASSGDNVLAVHVQEPTDSFDPNSFHIHEDLCKSKQVEFQIKICTGSSFLKILAHEVALHLASILVIGCSSSRLKEPFITSCLQELPPTCYLLVLDNGGRILFQQAGTSPSPAMTPTFQHSLSSLSTPGPNTNKNQLSAKVFPALSTSRSLPTYAGTGLHKVMNKVQFFSTKIQKQVHQLTLLDSKGGTRHFTPQELGRATEKFRPSMVIGESNHSIVYRGNLKDGRAVAVKVLRITKSSEKELLQEVDILSGLNHEHIVQLVGYCYSRDMHAVVYNLLQGSLKQNLKSLRWKERMSVAVGVAKALKYLHHSCKPPIIHRDVKSDNILLTEQSRPQLSDFGTAMVNNQPQKYLSTNEQINVVGTFGYLAPEYVMYGKVNNKIDVYSYGVVLLELITGKTAIEKNMEFKHGSLVLWARSLLSRGLFEQLIDPDLSDDYNKEEMQRMTTVAQLCLRQLPSRRPAITKVMKLLDEPEYWVKMRRETENHVNKNGSNNEPQL